MEVVKMKLRNFICKALATTMVLSFAFAGVSTNAAVKYGDVNLDGVVTASDASVVLQYVLNQDSIEFTADQMAAAGVLGGTTLTSSDAATILSKVLNNDFKFAVEEIENPTQATTVNPVETTTQTTTEKPVETTTQIIIPDGEKIVLNANDGKAGANSTYFSFDGTVNEVTDDTKPVGIVSCTENINGTDVNFTKALGLAKKSGGSIVFKTPGPGWIKVFYRPHNESQVRVLNFATSLSGTDSSHKSATAGARDWATFKVTCADTVKLSTSNSEGMVDVYYVEFTADDSLYVEPPEPFIFAEQVFYPETSGAFSDEASSLFVSPTGTATAAGTKADPMDLNTAIASVQQGQTIYMLGGTYTCSEQVTIDQNNYGAKDAFKRLIAYNGEEVILDCYSQPYNSSDVSTNARGLQLNGHFWHIKGLTVKGAADNGIFIAGHNNIVEGCIAIENRDSGIQYSRRLSSMANMADWPSYNLLLNCSSFNNFDTDNGEDADGLAVKLSSGIGNVVKGCMSYNNVDDGWDCYMKKDRGPIGAVTFEECIAFRNGQNEAGKFTVDSDGQGYKIGTGSSEGGLTANHSLTNCMAFENKNHGFTQNSSPSAFHMINCTSFNNSRYDGKKSNFDFGNKKALPASDSEFKNLLSFNTDGKLAGDKFVGTVENSIFWYDDVDGFRDVTTATSINTHANSTRGPKAAVAPTASDFVSTTAPAVGTNFHKEWRNADGTINTKGFMKLTASSSFATRNIGAQGLSE